MQQAVKQAKIRGEQVQVGRVTRLAKRSFDVVFGIILLVFMLVPMALIAVAVRLTSKGPALYWSDRVGVNNEIFQMPKFRSMRTDAPQVATHLLRDPDEYLSPIGAFLRRSSLDELPQLFSIISGDLSFVGPRPALFNQDDLIELRTERGVHRLTPGLTGWAQINGRDDLPIPTKVDYDHDYLRNHSLWLDLKILFLTLVRVVSADGVSH